MKLLIVDDSSVVRERLTTLLSQLDNVEVVGQAGNVENAISEIDHLRPDLIIMDIKMPGGCGIDVLETMKNKEGRPVVIMLTNYPYPQYQKRCFEAGANFFFDKSAEFEAAIDLIRSLASQSVSSGGVDETKEVK